MVKQINFNELAELGSSSQSREDGTVGPSSLPVDDPAVLRIEDAIQSCHLASSDSNTRSRSRTLSKSSRTSVDSLRTQGNHSGLGNKFTASHCGSPLCTSEVYELSHYIDYGSTEASMTVKNPNKMLLTIDMDTSAVLVANSVASAVFGYSRTEFEGLHFEELLHSDNYLGTMSLLEEHCGSDGEQLMVPEQLVGHKLSCCFHCMHCLLYIDDYNCSRVTMAVQWNSLSAYPGKTYTGGVFGWYDLEQDPTAGAYGAVSC